MDNVNVTQIISSLVVVSFIPMLFFGIPISITGYLLAKQKDRNHIAWAICGLIPYINTFAIIYFIGATDLNNAYKLDYLIKQINEIQGRIRYKEKNLNKIKNKTKGGTSWPSKKSIHPNHPNP